MQQHIFLETPLGPLEISGSDLGVRSVRFVDRAGKGSDDPCSALTQCRDQLREYFEGNRKNFDLKLDWSGEPEFHQEVWRMLLQIPYGHTTSYGAIAEKLGNPRSVRAVGQANAHNPIPIIVPCHRVIAKNGDLQGYYYGLDVKRRLLELENPMSFGKQGALFV